MIASSGSVRELGAFRVVHLRGSAYERGMQHGTILRESVRLFRDAFYRDLLYARSKLLGASLNGMFLTLATRMERYIPRELRDEMRGVADGAGVGYHDILILNCFDDAIHGLAKLAPVMQAMQRVKGFFACSSFVRLGAMGPVHGRNLDYMVADSTVDPNGVVTRVLRENVIVFIHDPQRGHRFMSVAWPGLVGIVTGMNAAGISLACHTSWTPGETIHGVPLPLLYRHVVQYSSTLAETEQRLRRAPRTIGNNLSIAAGKEGHAMALELTPGHVASWEAREDVLAVTNHFQDPALLEPQAQAGWLFPNSLSRLDRLHTILPETPPTRIAAQTVLSDAVPPEHVPDAWHCIVNPGTIYSTVFEPASLRFSVRVFDRPDRPFESLDLSDRSMFTAAA